MKRTEADLAAAGLLEVDVVCTAGGRPRGLLERLTDPPACNPARAHRVLSRRPERRSERLQRRHAPWRRQQSDRTPRRGVPGLYVRRRDLPRNCQGKAPRLLYGTTSLEQASELTPTETRAGVAGAQARRPRSRPPDQDDRQTRSSGSTAPRLRWAALSRWRTAGTGRARVDRLREGARSGAPPCPIAAAAFELVFVSEDGWGLDDSGRPLALLDGYRPIGDRWAARLEAYCRIHDRATGELGSGLLSLLEDLFAWTPADGAPRGRRHDLVDHGDRRGDVTRHTDDPGFPASLAYFIARLGLRAKALRRRGDARRRFNSAEHRADVQTGRIRPPGDPGTPRQIERRLDAIDDYAELIDELERDAQDRDDVR